MPALAIGLYELLALFVAIGMALTAKHFSNGFLNWMKNAIGNLPLVGGVLSLNQILKLDRWITNRLGKYAEAVESRGVSWMGALAHYVYVTGYWALYWPIGLYHEVSWLLDHAIPRRVHAETRPIDAKATRAEAEAKAAAGKAHTAATIINKSGTVKKVTTIQRVAMPHAREWEWLHEHWAAVRHAVLTTVAVPTTIPGVVALPKPWGISAKQLRRYWRKIVNLTTVGGAVGLVALALTSPKLGLGWLRCRNVGRVGRALCGLDKALLDLLLLGAVEAFIITDLCAFTDLLGKAAKAQVPGLMELVDVEDALVGCHGSEKPLLFNLPPADLPPLQGVSPLAA